ncbi:MAG: nucleotidyl transferase AbiEii/AbiGii toxin family protein [Candidatus Cloacimonetes bacterium]|nr:nucleotidyl transferase AbiEii/AbiGii toxin family protein [Candidatus Cloacimonadota bacterium]MBL7085863.1 nucleotidyl transferase AbiEii/AbiGii toxin family protein [Candidatus Cloacimonadota bacterium]
MRPHNNVFQFHREILTKEQVELLRLIKAFKREFYIVGGTATALYLGHRRSIDFDLFKFGELRKRAIKDKIENNRYSYKIIHQSYEEFTIEVNSVKITFYNYPYNINIQINFDNIINLPTLLDLAAMKALALGGRAKWKDYVDLYFILREYYSLKDISLNAKKIFRDHFSEKLFHQQLCYFEDIDYSESIDYIDTAVKDIEIKNFLTNVATTLF